MKQTTIRQWRRAAMLLLLTVMTTATATATDTVENYITDVMVIGGSKADTDTLKKAYSKQGWEVINKDLNAGCGSGSDYIYLLYKQKSDSIASVGDFITGFIISTATGTIPDNLTHEGYTYYLVPFDGSDYFKGNKGDLNSHCGSSSATIHLYYRKKYHSDGDDYSTVRSISFDNKQSGAVTTADGSTGYDLNTGCGSSSDYIYMHADKAPGWEITENYAGTECIIKGFDGPKRIFKELDIPTAIGKATVLGFSGMSFSGFTNLETMRFGTDSSVGQMPSVQGCSKFKNVRTGSVDYTTPSSMTSIPGYAFAGTAVSEITLTAVTSVGANVFSGCKNTLFVTFNTSPVGITYDAFSNISSTCTINYPGSMDDWHPSMYMYSPNLVVKGSGGNNNWSCGWCGGADAASENYLHWTLNTSGHLNIDWLWEGDLEKQEISTHNWSKDNVKSLTLNHVYAIGDEAFEGCANLSSVTIPNSVMSIGNFAFSGCSSLTSPIYNSTLFACLPISFSGHYNIPDGIKEICGGAFDECTGLTSVTIPNSVTKIEFGAFSVCEGLTSVTIPNSVTSIGNYAFQVCSSLKDLYFDGTEALWNDVTKGNGWNDRVHSGFTEHWRCTVTFDANGHGTAPDPQTNLWSSESKVTEPAAPTATGFAFTGWYTDAACTTPWNFNSTVAHDMTLYAGWKMKGDANGDGQVTIADALAVVNYILGQSSGTFVIQAADVNNDSHITIADAVGIVSIIL